MAIFERPDNGTEVAAVDFDNEFYVRLSTGVELFDSNAFVLMTSLLTKLPAR